MGKNRELTVSERSQIIGLLKGGHMRKEISDILDFPLSTVKSTIQRYGSFKTPLSKKRSGRPRLLGGNEQSILKEIVKTNNKAAASSIQNSINEATGINVSVRKKIKATS